MKKMPVVGLILSVLMISSSALCQEVAAPEMTFRSNSRLVVVDVVVTNSRGEAVTGLTRDDFTVVEDGRVQTLRSFEAHTGEAQTVQTARPRAGAIQSVNAGATEHTNAPAIESEGPVNVLVLDLLNTEMADQIRVRRQAQEYVKRMPQGHLLTVFAIGQELTILQGVTGDASKVAAALEKVTPMPPALLKTDTQKADDQKQVDLMAAINPMAATAVAEAICREEGRQIDSRVEITLHAMREMRRLLAAYPGRKNLIWISGGLPLRFDPRSEFPEYIVSSSDMREYREQLRELGDYLAAAKVAVYFVNARGLEPYAPDAVLGAKVQGKIRAAGFEIRDSMTELAEQTGGKALFNNNDAGKAMAESVGLGSSYYTLAYVPSNGKWDGKFRQIKVSLKGKAGTLAYRRGYFAVGEDARPAEERLKQEAEALMHPKSLGSTEIVLKAAVSEPGANGKVKVQYWVERDQLPTRDANNRQRALVMDFMVTAWDEQGNVTGKTWQTVRIGANTKSLAAIEAGGFSKVEELKVGAGTRYVRVGLMDRNTGKVGTLDVRLGGQGTAGH